MKTKRKVEGMSAGVCLLLICVAALSDRVFSGLPDCTAPGPVTPPQRLSPFTTEVFAPDGNIHEFISVSGNDQEYFVTAVGDDDLGAIKAGALLTRGVFVTRDDEPVSGEADAAGVTGFFDRPCGTTGVRVPTGFNIGRVFVSYNPDAYGGEGAYFLAMDISAPAALDALHGTVPVAFDVDGDGSPLTQTENFGPGTVSEAPTQGVDVYTFALDLDLNGFADVEFTISEQVTAAVPFGKVSINPPRAAVANDPCLTPGPGQNRGLIINGQCVQRFVEFTDGTGLFPGDPVSIATDFMDTNDDGCLDYQDVGVGQNPAANQTDVEIVLRNLRQLHELLDTDTNFADSDPACVRLRFQADTFDDVACGGAEDRVFTTLTFPVPDIEVTKEARCADEPGDLFGPEVDPPATPGSAIEFRVTIQNFGNVPLAVSLTDALSCVSPASASFIGGTCAIQGAAPPGIIANFCTAFQNAINTPGNFPLAIGTLAAADACATGLGEQLVFTFRARLGPGCSDAAACANAVSVTAALAGTAVDPILRPFPPGDGTPDDGEEEDCENAACCASRCCDEGCCNLDACNGGCCSGSCAGVTCTTNDNAGDVPDEFRPVVVDDDSEIDTDREVAADGDDNVVTIDLNCRDVDFRKEVRLRPSGPFVSGNTALALPGPGGFPVDIEYRYTATNNGDVAEMVALNDAQLCADVSAAGATLVSCPLCPSGSLMSTVTANGGTLVTNCVIRFPTLASALIYADRDDAGEPTCGGQALTHRPDPLCYVNCANSTADSGFCAGVIAAEAFASVCFAPECELEVEKTVVCLSSCTNGTPAGVPSGSLDAVAGSCAQFRIEIRNTASPGGANIPLVCIEDTKTCNWAESGLAADIAGDDVSGLLTGFTTDGSRQCFDLSSRLNGIAPGETLTITYNVRVPDPFPAVNQDPDCRNRVDVEGYPVVGDDTNVPADADCADDDAAVIDVHVPRIECQKSITVDLGNDGSVDVPATASANVAAAVYPMRITYNLGARNTGELALSNVEICDSQLVADALAAGITIGPCDLCNGPCNGVNDTCASAIPLNPGQSTTRTCQFIVTNQEQFNALAGRDQDDDGECYENTAESHGDVSSQCTPATFTPRVTSTNGCEAVLCVTPRREKELTKAKFDIWNENEVRFSGTERCILSWDQRMLSEYTGDNIANHFLRTTLQTEKGRARIDGVASSVVCGGTSIDAPLLGVAAKLINFGPGGVDWAGTNLHGTGTERGEILYDLVPGDGGERGGLTPDDSARSGITKKGSLVVFTKVEIKWDNLLRPIQDTFISLKNDVEDPVRVQLYLVNGDQPTPPIEFDGQVIERGHLGCNSVDVEIPLSGNQPIYWSVFTGNPRGVSPFTILDPGFPPGRPDRDARNPGGRVLRGYVLGWAVNSENEEIRWNHLLGDAVIINYRDSSAWEYNSWNFAAVADVAQGAPLLSPLGHLALNGIEYDYAPEHLLLDFYASGAVIFSNPSQGFFVDTDLTLWVAKRDLRQDAAGGR